MLIKCPRSAANKEIPPFLWFAWITEVVQSGRSISLQEEKNSFVVTIGGGRERTQLYFLISSITFRFKIILSLLNALLYLPHFLTWTHITFTIRAGFLVSKSNHIEDFSKFLWKSWNVFSYFIYLCLVITKVTTSFPIQTRTLVGEQGSWICRCEREQRTWTSPSKPWRQRACAWPSTCSSYLVTTVFCATDANANTVQSRFQQVTLQ